MRAPRFRSQALRLALGATLLTAEISFAQEQPEVPLTDSDTNRLIAEHRAEAESRLAFVQARNKAESRILKAERKRARLIFSEAKAEGVVLAYAIPQPDPAEIERFMARLKNLIATTKSELVLALAKEQIVALPKRFGFDQGRLRAVYIFIPIDKEQALKRVSFPAETEAECEKFIREDLKPVKLEIGKPHQGREGVRAAVWEISHGWDGEELVKDQGLEDMLENWVDWHRKSQLRNK